MDSAATLPEGAAENTESDSELRTKEADPTAQTSSGGRRGRRRTRCPAKGGGTGPPKGPRSGRR
eukprot:13975278-Alexandrium_andersonii.AAC.1